MLVHKRCEEGAENGRDNHSCRHLRRCNHSRIVDAGVSRRNRKRRGDCVASHRGDGRTGNTGAAGNPIKEDGDNTANDQRHQTQDDAAEAAALARTLGQVWQASPTAGLYAITADADFEAHFGKKAAKRRKIYNGMIPCQIYMYFDRPVKPVRK